MQTRVMGIILFILFLVVTVPMVTTLFEQAPPEAVDLQTLEFPGDRQIQITAKLVMGRSLGMYYRTLAPQAVDKEPAFFVSLPLESLAPEFVTHQAEDGNLIGIAMSHRPLDILVIHDFASDESWPRHDMWESVEELQARGQAMFDRLAAAHPDQNLSLLRAEGLRQMPAIAATQPAE